MDTSREILNIVATTPGTSLVKQQFRTRLKAGRLTRDENSCSHFCVYFAGYDKVAHRVFIGHHKKSGLWLFNGGHIDRGDNITSAMLREIHEEWGDHSTISPQLAPLLLTITEIENPTKQPCKIHFDIWFFISLDKSSFTPHAHLLEKEFFDWGWKTHNEAKALIRNKETNKALSAITLLFT